MRREYWGKGIATRALADFLSMVKERPLYAFTAKTNLAYIRVLHKCGFRQIGGEQEFSQVNGENVEGVIVMLRLSERRGKMQGRVWTFREETVGEVRSRAARYIPSACPAL